MTTTAEVGLRGEVPGVLIHRVSTSVKEREKYTEVWRDIPEYRNKSPGLENVDRFMETFSPNRGRSLLDAGCGAGVAGLKLAEKGLKVTYLDITSAGLDPSIDRKYFIESSLWENWNTSARFFDFGYCCDVMEHIPTEFTMLSAKNLIGACTLTWFQISLMPDEFGRLIGTPLHLTVQSFMWWRDRLDSLGLVTEARDLGTCAVFVVERRPPK